MQAFMTLRIALRALARNKLRAFLTMLGIIIGVGAVIAMVAIGEGAKSTIRAQIAALGTNVLIVLPGSNVQGGVRAGFGNVNTLLDSDGKAMARELPSVAFVSPVLRRQDQVVAGNLNWGTLAQGVAPEFQQIRDWQVAEGRFLHEGDMHWGLEVQLNQLLKSFSETIFQGNYEAPVSFGIGLSRKDVGLANELGRRLNVPMPIAAWVEQIMIEAINRGWSDQSTVSLFRLQEEAAGIEARKSK